VRRTYRGRAEIIIAVLSLLVVTSMILGTLLSVLPSRESQTQVTPTVRPTATRAAATPTPVEPSTPTPTPVLQPAPLPKPTS
jgi:hypothetical protein